MIVRKCTRCGEHFKDDAWNSKNNRNAIVLATMHRGSETSFNYTDSKIFDLCPDCMVKFEQWLSNEEEKNDRE